MRLKLTTAAIIGAAMLLATTTWANTNPITWNFDSPTGVLGTSHTYTAGGITLTAYGFSNMNSPTDLYGKNLGGDEQGLGIAGLPNNEIGGSAFVQIDLTPLLAQFTSGFLSIGSVQSGENYDIWVSNTLGQLGTEIIPNGTGNDTQIPISFVDGSPYLGISAGTSGNVLLSTLSVSPEPTSLSLFGIGLFLAAFLVRRSKLSLNRLES
ncbi:MAG TPA: PEP-CTERM sorting domain-containing protein [Terriglobia bacterium]|nr:PEP-CTERM sorting domain-containing protein [Terriglobia bacterium]